MLHHCGLLQPLQSSEQTFEDSFINFPKWDKRKEIWGLDFPHRKKKEERVKKTKRKMRVSLPNHTQKNPWAYIFDNNDDQKLFFRPLFEWKIHPQYNWYILFLLILNSAINECWREQLSHRRRQLRSVCTQKVSFPPKCEGKNGLSLDRIHLSMAYC